MNRLYFVGAVAAGLAAFYFYGRAVGDVRCRADRADTILQMQTQTIKQVEKINAETFNTASRDIRRVLREKYTIAD